MTNPPSPCQPRQGNQWKRQHPSIQEIANEHPRKTSKTKSTTHHQVAQPILVPKPVEHNQVDHNLTSACPEKPLSDFNFDSKAAEKNCLVLKRFDFAINRAIKAQSLLPLGYSSEFRKENTISPLLKHHPL
jgi:hypothetical protein